jgi:hypothetical protein
MERRWKNHLLVYNHKTKQSSHLSSFSISLFPSCLQNLRFLISNHGCHHSSPRRWSFDPRRPGPSSTPGSSAKRYTHSCCCSCSFSSCSGSKPGRQGQARRSPSHRTLGSPTLQEAAHKWRSSAYRRCVEEACRLRLQRREAYRRWWSCHSCRTLPKSFTASQNPLTCKQNVETFPILTDLGISTTVAFLGACGINTPHVHPRATEFLTVC